MCFEDTEETSGYYVPRIEAIVALAASSEYDAEASLLKGLICGYLDMLVSRSSPCAFTTADSVTAFLIICRLLKNPTVSVDVCKWLWDVVGTASDTLTKVMLEAGIFGPSLEPPIRWSDDEDVRRVNCLLSFLEDERTMWAPIWAYSHGRDKSANETLRKIRQDIERLNDWRSNFHLPPISVDWQLVASIQVIEIAAMHRERRNP